MMKARCFARLTTDSASNLHAISKARRDKGMWRIGA